IEILSPAAKQAGWSAYYAELELGRVELKRGLAEQAWEHWQEARRTAEALGSPTEVAARLRGSAFLDLDLGKVDRAAGEISDAIRIASSVGDEQGTARGGNLEGLLLQKRNAPNASLLAQEKYARLLDGAYQRGDDDDTRAFAAALATALAEGGNAGEARS